MEGFDHTEKVMKKNYKTMWLYIKIKMSDHQSLRDMGFDDSVVNLAITYDPNVEHQVTHCVYLNDFGRIPKRLCQHDGFEYTFIGSTIKYHNMDGIVKAYDDHLKAILIHMYHESPWNMSWVALHDPFLEWSMIHHHSVPVYTKPEIVWKRSLGVISLPLEPFFNHNTIEESWRYNNIIRSEFYNPLWNSIYRCCSNNHFSIRITPNDPEDIKTVNSHKIFWKNMAVKAKLILYCDKYKIPRDVDNMLDHIPEEDTLRVQDLLYQYNFTRDYLVHKKEQWESECVPYILIKFIDKNDTHVRCELFIHNESFRPAMDNHFIELKHIMTYMQEQQQTVDLCPISKRSVLSQMKAKKKRSDIDPIPSLMKHQNKALSWMMYRERKRNKTINGWGWSKRKWDDGFVCYESVWGELKRNIPGSIDIYGGILSLPIGSGKTAICCHLIEQNKGRTLVVVPTTLLSVWASEMKKHTPNCKYMIYSARKQIPEDIEVLFVSYRSCMNSFDRLENIAWARLICDETHTYKNSSVKTITNIANITARNRWCITATPIHEKIEYTDTLLKILNIPIFYNKTNQKNNLKRILDVHDVSVASVYKHHIHRLFRDISYYKSKVFSYNTTHEIVYCDHPKEWSSLYKMFLNQNEYRHKQLVFFKHMRMLASHPCLVPLYRFGTAIDSVSDINTTQQDHIVNTLDDTSEFHQQVRDIIINGGSCAICLEPIDKPTITDCKHIFCKECIQRNYEIRKECPHCRHPIQNLTEIVAEHTEQDNTIRIRIGNINYHIDKNIHDTYHQASNTRPKIDKLVDIIKSSDDKIVVFTSMTRMLSTIERRLMEEDISFCIIRGSQTSKKRASMVEDFQNDSSKRVFLLTLRSCAEGLTLTSSSHVVFMEPCMTSQVFEQALGRVKRIGQTKNIKTTTIAMKQTMDQVIYQKTEGHKKSIRDHRDLIDGVDCESFTIYRGTRNHQNEICI